MRPERTSIALVALHLAGCSSSTDHERDLCESASLGSIDPDAGWLEAELAVVDEVNALRATGGCCGDIGCFEASTPLALDPNLRDAAVAHARDMAERSYLSHDSLSATGDAGSITAFERMAIHGVTACTTAENVSRGQPTAAAVVSVWMESPEHCANILWPALSHIGVGHAESSDVFGHYWVQDFGG